MRQKSEPSVEEILESIKKVIARDTRTDALQRPRREPESAPQRGAGVLDLTEVAAQILANDRAPLRDNDDFDAEDEPALVDRAKAESMRDSLATLAMMAQPGAAPQIVRSGETSLEGMVRDMLRPMLAEWLDTNLPAMVEKMVSTEIARILGKRS
jgi:cell pole-organizing protein PopZ